MKSIWLGFLLAADMLSANEAVGKPNSEQPVQLRQDFFRMEFQLSFLCLALKADMFLIA